VTSDEQTLLVIGLSAPERCSELVEDLQKLLREQPPAAVLFVSGRDRTQAQAQSSSYAAAFSL
jgi:arginine utilization protein RocB